MSHTSTSQGKPITGRFVLIVILSFFSVVIGVNAVMMRLAVATLPGTEVDSAYGASLAYQKEIQAALEQDARRWKVEVHVERRSNGDATLSIHAKDADATPLAGLEISSHFERPTDRRADRSADIVERGNGIYNGSTQGLAPGQWDLVIEADRGGKRLFLSHNRVILN
jgi:nitrogen fixation protein FixH